MANALTATDATAWRRCSRHPIQCNESQRIGSNAPSSGDNVCINDKFHRALWTLRYGELIEYKEKHGDCNVPRHNKSFTQLGNWVYSQRTQYRYLQQGRHSTMTTERIHKLDELGFFATHLRGSTY